MVKNTAKRVSIATEFDKFKDVLFNEKTIRHTMKRTQSKKHKLGTMKLIKYFCHVLTIKDACQMMEFARYLIFIKTMSEVVKLL